MEQMEDKIGAILNNPQMMQQIMSMVQSLGQSEAPRPEPPPEPAPSMPDIDPAMITKMMSIAGNTGPDKEQEALLHALRPYLTSNRIDRLEKAMRAAKLAGLASGFLGNFSLSGR